MAKMAKITREMTMGEVIGKYPKTAAVFMKHGFHCVGCPVSEVESVEEGAQLHRINLQKLLTDLNKAAEQ